MSNTKMNAFLKFPPSVFEKEKNISYFFYIVIVSKQSQHFNTLNFTATFTINDKKKKNKTAYI